MPSFAERVIAAHQAGLSEKRAAEELAQRTEDRKLQQDILKHQVSRLKIQDALENRAAQQAAGQFQVGQPAANIAPQPISGVPELNIPDTTYQPQSMEDLLKQKAHERMLQPPVFAPAGSQPFAPTEAGGYAPSGEPVPKEQTLPALLQEVKAVTPNFDTLDPAGKIKAIADYNKNTKAAPGASNLSPDTKMLNGKATDVLVGTDPDNKEMFGKVFLPTAAGLQDVTGQASHYEKPIDRTAGANANYNARLADLNKHGDPVATSITQFSKLIDDLNTGTPITDALVAPALLVAMVGGQNSGVRITNSEQQAIFGAQSKVEQVKVALRQWSSDPLKANKILEPLRDQIKQLVAKVNDRLIAKQTIIEEARQNLIDVGDDVKAQKQTVATAEKNLSAIDQGKIIVKAPDGSFHYFDNQTQATTFKKLANIP